MNKTQLINRKGHGRYSQRIEIVSQLDYYAIIPQALIRDPNVSIPARLSFGLCHSFSKEKDLKKGSNSFLSLATLGKMLGRHPVNASRYLKELERAGWITIIHRGLTKTNIIILHARRRRRSIQTCGGEHIGEQM